MIQFGARMLASCHITRALCHDLIVHDLIIRPAAAHIMRITMMMMLLLGLLLAPAPAPALAPAPAKSVPAPAPTA